MVNNNDLALSKEQALRTRHLIRRDLTHAKNQELPTESSSDSSNHPVAVLTAAPQSLGSLPDHYSDYFQLPGLQNRLLLSLKSTLPEETDFALEILLAASCYDPELLPSGRFPGFLEPLLDLIQLYRSPGPFEHQSLQPVRRRALESALVLRNLLSIDSNLSGLPSNHPRLLHLVLRALKFTRLNLDHEFVSLMLDVLHSLSSNHLIRLDQPLEPSNIPLENVYPSSSYPLLPENPSDQPLQSDWSVQLLLGLEQLCQSSDRALVLDAYRTLTSIASLSSNQLPFSNFVLNNHHPRQDYSPPWSQVLDRALILLALPDVELLMSVLDYLFVVTSINSIAHAICTLHRDIYSILKLLLSHLHHHRKISNESPQHLPTPEERWYFQPAPPSETLQALLELDSDSPHNQAVVDSNATRTAPQTLTMSEVHQILLNESQMKDIINMPEPRRAQVWMSRAFEACPGAEVQQVTLWLAYKTQFEPLYANNSKFSPNHPNQMIAPAEAIKLTSDVFPNALPSVTEHKNGEKKFVISGMRVRPKKHASIWKCNWKECIKNPMDEDYGSAGNETVGVSAHAERLYQHIAKAHIAPRANKCHWLTCTYQAGNRSELLYHIRTHIPSIPPSNKKTPIQQAKKNNKNESHSGSLGDQSKFLPFKSYVHQRWETPNNGIYSSENLPHQPDLNLPHQLDPLVGQPGGGAIGIGFVSLLVLRNLIQCVSDALNEMLKSTHPHAMNQSSASMRIDDEFHSNLDLPIAKPNIPNYLDGTLDQSQPAIISLAQLISGFPTKAALDDGDSDHHHPSNTLNDDQPGEQNGTIQDESACEIYGNGFIEKKLLEFVLNDRHLQNIGVDMLKKISSISQNLYLISKQ